MNKKLKEAIKSELDNVQLSDDRLHQLLARQAASARQNKHPVGRRFSIASVAAMILISALCGYFLASRLSLNNINHALADEVASNHLNMKPLEVQAGSINGIRSFFQLLDFSLAEPGLLADAGKQLLGGRYCSIQGVTSAQLRVRDVSSGEIQSLYQTRYDPALFSEIPTLEEGEQPVDITVQGLRVDVWVEKGVLFALTHVE